MTQVLYAHMNNKTIKKPKKTKTVLHLSLLSIILHLSLLSIILHQAASVSCLSQYILFLTYPLLPALPFICYIYHSHTELLKMQTRAEIPTASPPP
jgi:hypothetical protein